MTDIPIISWSDLSKPCPGASEYHERLQQAKALTIAARDLDTPPQPEARNRVRIRGERLSRPILWRGRQWAVTRYGVECRDGSYCIERTRLWENDDRYSWVRHMAGKTWVDLPDFAEALRIARATDAASTIG